MFSLASGIYESYFAAPKLNVLVIGMEASGKTTLLERIKVTQFANKPPRKPKQQQQQQPGIRQRSQSEDFGARIPKPTEHKRAVSHPHMTMLHNSTSSVSSGNGETENHRGSEPHTNGEQHKEPGNKSNDTTPETTSPAEQTPPPKPRSRFLPSFSCPAPKRYSIKAMKDDDDDEEYAPGGSETAPLTASFSSIPEVSEESDRTSLETGSTDGDLQTTASEETPIIANKQQQQQQLRHQYSSRLSSMESVDLTDNDRSIIAEEGDEDEPDQQQDEDVVPTLPDKQYNVLPKKHMLPLHKIRPTSGTNLAKNVSICGCQVFFFDVSGKFQDLWSSYYDDADAIIFCVGTARSSKGSSDEDDDNDEERNNEILDKVRQQVEDDVPFLIWRMTEDQDAEAPPLSDFLPHYSSNLMQVFVGSNWTGYGVKEALEWLVPMAKRMKTQRLQQQQLLAPPLPPKEV